MNIDIFMPSHLQGFVKVDNFAQIYIRIFHGIFMMYIFLQTFENAKTVKIYIYIHNNRQIVEICLELFRGQSPVTRHSILRCFPSTFLRKHLVIEHGTHRSMVTALIANIA